MTSAHVRSELLEVGLKATRQGRAVAFRANGLGGTAGEQLELVRDVVAMANSGGGVVLIGVDRGGRPIQGWAPPLETQLHDLLLAVEEKTGRHFAEVELMKVERLGREIYALVVDARAGSPLVFEKPGIIVRDDGPAAAIFPAGTVYFRHGARSEPATARDIERFFNHELSRVRRSWLRNVRKIAAAPPSAEVLVSVPDDGPHARLERFRVVNDPDVPAVALTDFDVTHPYRQKELIRTVNRRIGSDLVGPYEILSVRRVHDTDSREEFFHRPKFGSPQYSDAFVSWLVAEHAVDHTFFDKAKERYKVSKGATTGRTTLQHPVA